jgi:hypothetical protein
VRNKERVKRKGQLPVKSVCRGSGAFLITVLIASVMAKSNAVFLDYTNATGQK